MSKHLTTNYRLELTAINALNKLIHNYRREDVIYLCQNHSFDYAWHYYWEGDHQTLTIPMFWETWADKFDLETQAFLLDYAMQRYGEEAYRNIDGAADWKKRFKDQHSDTPDADD
jgi:hypothetical protein